MPSDKAIEAVNTYITMLAITSVEARNSVRRREEKNSRCFA